MSRNHPAEIEEQSIALNQIKGRRDEALDILEEITDEITREVLAETDPLTGKPRHTNEQARELAVRERQRASGQFQTWDDIRATEDRNLLAAAARLERLRGEFAECKITRRERIAAIEAAIN